MPWHRSFGLPATLIIIACLFQAGCNPKITEVVPAQETVTTAAVPSLVPTAAAAGQSGLETASTPMTSATPTAQLTMPPPPSLTPVSTAIPVEATSTPEAIIVRFPPGADATPGIAHIAAVGDIMLSRTLGSVIEKGRLGYPFGAVEPYLVPPDFTVGNLETALGTFGNPHPNKKFTFQSPPGAAEALAIGGFDLVTLANNHALDYGPEALLEGISLLEEAGVAAIGAGPDRTTARRPYLVDINGVRLAFLGYVNVLPEPEGFDTEDWEATADSPGLAWGRLEELQADVRAVKPLVDHVIVLLHAGYEYLRFPSEAQVELSHGAIEAGATLVIGHHAHILQGVKRYREGLIVYGLGNFAFNIDGDPRSAILHVWLDQDGVVDHAFLPVILEETGRPRPAVGDEIDEILEQIRG